MGVHDLVVAEKRAIGLTMQSLLMLYRTHSETGDLSDGVATANCVSKPLLPLFVHVFPESLLQLYWMARGCDFHLKTTCVNCESMPDSWGAKDESTTL